MKMNKISKIPTVFKVTTASYNFITNFISFLRQIAGVANVLPVPISAIIKFISLSLELLLNTITIMLSDAHWKDKLESFLKLLAVIVLAIVATALTIAFPSIPMICASAVLALCVVDFGTTVHGAYKTYKAIKSKDAEITDLHRKLEGQEEKIAGFDSVYAQYTLSELKKEEVNLNKKSIKQLDLNRSVKLNYVSCLIKQKEKDNLRSIFKLQRISAAASAICIAGAVLLIVAAAPLVTAIATTAAAITLAASIVFISAQAIWAGLCAWRLKSTVKEVNSEKSNRTHEENVLEHENSTSIHEEVSEGNTSVQHSHYSKIGSTFEKACSTSSERLSTTKHVLPTEISNKSNKKSLLDNILSTFFRKKEEPKLLDDPKCSTDCDNDTAFAPECSADCDNDATFAPEIRTHI